MLKFNSYELYGLTRIEIKSSANIIKTNYDLKELIEIFKSIQPDILIHAAGSSSVQESIKDPLNDFLNSSYLFKKIVESIRIAAENTRIVFLSSAAVYGDIVAIPMSENFTLKPISPYGFNKLICEQIAREYSEIFNIPVLIVRLFSVFGYEQKKLIIWELFKKFSEETSVTIEGTGNEVRDFLYIEDFAEILMELLVKNNKNFNIINLASGQSYRIIDIAIKMKNFLKNSKNIQILNKERFGNPKEWVADITKCESILERKINYNFDSRLKSVMKIWTKGKY